MEDQESCDETTMIKERPYWKDSDDSESSFSTLFLCNLFSCSQFLTSELGGSESDGSSLHTEMAAQEIDTPLTTPADEGLRKRIKRKKIKGYFLNSDDENHSDSEESCSASSSTSSYGPRSEKRPLISDTSMTCVDDDEDYEYTNSLIIRTESSGEVIRFVETDDEGHEHSAKRTRGWLAFMSDLRLPLYTEKIVVPPNLTKPEKVICTFTMYSEMAAACCDDDFAKVFGRLQHEWTFIGGLVRSFPISSIFRANSSYLDMSSFFTVSGPSCVSPIALSTLLKQLSNPPIWQIVSTQRFFQYPPTRYLQSIHTREARSQPAA